MEIFRKPRPNRAACHDCGHIYSPNLAKQCPKCACPFLNLLVDLEVNLPAPAERVEINIVISEK